MRKFIGSIICGCLLPVSLWAQTLEGNICTVTAEEMGSNTALSVQFDADLNASMSVVILDTQVFKDLFVYNEDIEHKTSRGETFMGRQFGDGYQIDMTARYILNHVTNATSSLEIRYTFDGEFNLVRVDYLNTRETPRMFRRTPRVEVEDFTCYIGE